jgi:hypothetical protein
LEPPRHKFHRQIAEDRGGGLQFGCRQRPDRWRGGHASLGRAFRLCRPARKGGLGAGVPCRIHLLSLNGANPRQRPFEERRDDLSRLVHGVDNILFSEALSAGGRSCSPKPASWVWRGSCQRAQAADIGVETAGIALPDLLLALATCERRGDLSRPCGARYTDRTARYRMDWVTS